MDKSRVSAEQIEWERTCSGAITSDSMWKLNVFRAALFLVHVSRIDSRALRAVPGMEGVASQLARAAPSVSANLSEGYSRAMRPDRLRFLDYALGSARECVIWYEAAKDAVDAETIEQRMELLRSIRAQLLGLIRSSREKRHATRFER